MSRTQQGIVFSLIGTFCLAFEVIFVKICYEAGFNENSVLTFRFLLGGILFVIFGLLAKQKLLLNRKQLLWALPTIILYILTARILYVGYHYLPSGTAVFFFFTYPIFTVLIEWLWQKEPFSKVKMIALGLSILGLLLFSLSSLGELNILGVSCCLIAAVFQSLYLVTFVRFSAKAKASEYTFSTTMLLVSTVILLLLHLGRQEMALPTTINGWLPMLAIAAICTLLAVFLCALGTSHAGASISAIVFAMQVPFAALLAFLFFGDRWTPLQFVGAALLLLAVLFVNFAALKKQKGTVKPNDTPDRRITATME